MVIPSDFVFSPSNLQDFVDCRRRFYYRYLEQRRWPAVTAEPVMDFEQAARRGATFHHMVHQAFLGIEMDQSSSLIEDEIIKHWWSNFNRYPIQPLPEVHYPEVLLTSEISGYPIQAKIDLIAVEPGSQLLVVDWKTGRKRPARSWLENRLQTQCYPLLLVLAGSHLNANHQIQANQVSMIYWFAEHPQRPVWFQYDAERYQASLTFLSKLIVHITQLPSQGFDKTSDIEKCWYCPYRSLCKRGAKGGSVEAYEDDFSILREAGANFEVDPFQEAETRSIP